MSQVVSWPDVWCWVERHQLIIWVNGVPVRLVTPAPLQNAVTFKPIASGPLVVVRTGQEWKVAVDFEWSLCRWRDEWQRQRQNELKKYLSRDVALWVADAWLGLAAVPCDPRFPVFTGLGRYVRRWAAEVQPGVWQCPECQSCNFHRHVSGREWRMCDRCGVNYALYAPS